MSTLLKHFITPEEYLELDRKAEYPSEYHDGEIFPMEAVTSWHDWIDAQLITLMSLQLRGTNCDAFNARMRILVAASGLYTYGGDPLAAD